MIAIAGQAYDFWEGTSVPTSRQVALVPDQVLTRGLARMIFDHPQEPGRLIKVVDPDGTDARRAQNRNRPAIMLYGAFASWQREVSEYCRIMNRIGQLPDFIAGYHGFVMTNLGVGLVVERIGDPDGQLAPSIDTVAATQDHGLDLRSMIDTFFSELTRSGGVASDLNPRNLVVASRRGKPGLVLVDGLGDRVILPIRAHSTFFRERWLGRAKVKLCRELGLQD